MEVRPAVARIGRVTDGAIASDRGHPVRRAGAKQRDPQRDVGTGGGLHGSMMRLPPAAVSTNRMRNS